uniref:Uncharacterized protein n=1 Tax=Rhizophora mucronata TaxID=61149 RepID=A0A2P2NYL5_RHIMU
MYKGNLDEMTSSNKMKRKNRYGILLKLYWYRKALCSFSLLYHQRRSSFEKITVCPFQY